MPKSEFVERLVYYSQAPSDLVALVLEDMIVGETGKRDLRATPLIASCGYILVMPHLVTTLLWEASTQLLWARKYSGAYGKYITRHKTGLAKEFAGTFENRDVLVSFMRKVRDPSGNEIGDADVAVYDVADRFLALFEIKWLAPPEDILEVCFADEQLLHGVHQAAVVRQAVRDRPDNTLQQLFPKSRKLPAPADVDAFVLCRGSIGSEYVAGAEPSIFDYDKVQELVLRSEGYPLRRVAQDVPTTLQLPSDAGHFKLTHVSVNICGWDLRLPPARRESQSAETRASPSASSASSSPSRTSRSTAEAASKTNARSRR